MTRNLVIYRQNLLPLSETFILRQAEALRHFTPHYLGARRVEGLATPAGRTLLLNPGTRLGRAEEVLYKASGLAPRLLPRLRALRPALIHAHFGSDGVMALPLARQLRLPLVVTFHGYDATTHDAHLLTSPSLADRRLVTRRPRLIREGALFIAVSDHLRRELLARGFPTHRVVRHYNGIDVSDFAPAPGPRREGLVLFVGRHVEKKGGEDLLRAMRAVQDELPGARLVLIGDGPLRAEWERLAGELGLGCLFPGWQSPEQVRAWLAEASVFCLPSVTARSGDSEGLPTVLLEALATGLPVVTTAHAGNPEAVTHGETGFVVPERDPAALARALAELLRRSPLRTRFGEAARRDVRARFDAGRLGDELEVLYARVAPGRPGAGERAEPSARAAEALELP